jgi:transcriptional regulator with XRE-family HTH domain
LSSEISLRLQEQLLALRQRLGLTNSQLAGLIGTTEDQVRHYIKGRRMPKGKELIALGKLAGPPECWFWWGLVGLQKEDALKALGLMETLQDIEIQHAAELARSQRYVVAETQKSKQRGRVKKAK